MGDHPRKSLAFLVFVGELQSLTFLSSSFLTWCLTVPGYPGTWVPGYLGTRIPRYLGTQVPRFLGSLWRFSGRLIVQSK